MFKKIKDYIKAYKNQKKQEIAYLKELNWANIYHDSIRGNEDLQKLSLNIGRWAGSYAFFYVLNRILEDYKPNNIIELGLGESTKFISVFLKKYNIDANHIVIEHDEKWITHFKQNFVLSSRSEIINLKLITRTIKQHQSLGYDFSEELLSRKNDLYIIDGPYGSKHFSRYDICFLFEKISENDDFIILFDDFHRQGEKDTVSDIETILKGKKITYYMNVYKGVKDVCVIVSEKYKYISTL